MRGHISRWGVFSSLILIQIFSQVSGADESLVAKVCHSSRSVLVIDNFLNPKGPESTEVKPYIDVDGDGVPDVAHGELVSAFLLASHKSVKKYNLEKKTSLPEMVEHFATVLKIVKSGELDISAINLSQIIPLRFEALDEFMGFKVTPENIQFHSLAILKKTN